MHSDLDRDPDRLIQAAAEYELLAEALGATWMAHTFEVERYLRALGISVDEASPFAWYAANRYAAEVIAGVRSPLPRGLGSKERR